MNADAVLDRQSAETLGLEWLRSELEPLTEYGRTQMRNAHVFVPGQEIQARRTIDAIASMARTVSAEDMDAVEAALRACPDMGEVLGALRAGATLADADFLLLTEFAAALARIEQLVRGKGLPVTRMLPKVVEILERGRTAEGGFYLDERFDEALRAARERAGSAQAAFEVREERVVRSVAESLGRADLGTHEFILMRDEIAAPLPAGVRVVREAPAYYLCEVELDDDARSALAERDLSRAALAEIEHAVRAKLSTALEGACDDLTAACNELGDLDISVRKVRFTQRRQCVVPEIAETPILDFEDAVFLPLAAAIERGGRRYVPVSLRLDGVAIVTGPNMGGKTLALRTCGFIALCAAVGLPVPAKRAKTGLFGRIGLIDGTADGSNELLSSFAQEIVRLAELLAAPDGAKLLLLDEFARTTSPHEAEALARAVVAEIRRRGLTAAFATHLPRIALDTGARSYAVRGLRTRPAGERTAPGNQLADLMDYRIEEVSAQDAPGTDALVVAELLGLDPRIIKEARTLIEQNERA